ncbi:MAG TPA: enoyl-CoA hydratase/isomerase family protein [candidate division Zixibacteria bacterium]|nr:enoyl-CoA hydratase/isomerase family protein [candidate division Zixibacteria bacterium]
MNFRAIKWSIHDNPFRPGEPCIGKITLNRPDRLNAVDPLMRLELDALCNEIAHNSVVKVVILTGEGRGFCAGGDLPSEGEALGAFEGSMGITGPYKEMAEHFFNDLRHRVLQSAMRKLEDLPQVTIAAVNGPAVGVGLEMAALCDMRLASDRARFGEVAVAAGFVPESGGARNLPKLVGIGRAMRLILTGEIIDAKEALRIGLVDDVYPHARLMEEAFNLAGRIAVNPYLSVRHAKRLIKMYWNWNRTEEGYRQELDAVLEITRTEDCLEGMRAFKEKRRPDYRYPYHARWPFAPPDTKAKKKKT